MPVGAAISAVGSIAGAGIGAFASNSASKQQAAALQAQLAFQKQYIDKYVAPYASAGQDILPLLKSLITPGANMTATLSQIPGFQFAQDWGQKAVKNLGTTMGLGGNVLSAGADYATGKAQQGYGQIVNALQAYGNMGAMAAGGATNAGVNAGGTLGQIGQANAAGTLGMGNALAGGITGAGNAYLNYSLLSKLKGGGGAGGIYYSGSDY